MEGADLLLGGLGGRGDDAAASMKRDQESTDDFEHVESKREGNESPLEQHQASRSVTQNFLDMEREGMFLDTSTAPSGLENLDHIADKFTDSESDAGESPMHRPAVVSPKPSAPTLEPHHDPTASLIPSISPIPPTPPAVELTNEPPAAPKLVPEAKPEPHKTEQVKPDPPKHEPTKPEPPKPAFSPEPVIAQKPVPESPATKQEPARAPVAHVIEAEVIFCQMGLDAWFDPKRLHPNVESLIYWRDPAKSGAVLGAGLAVLIALACCSVVSVFAYASLLALSAAVAFRIYKNVLQAVQKTSEGHPFKWLLEKDVTIPAERAQSLAAGTTAHFNAAIVELRRLFLVEDLVDSLKFGVLLWCLTYVGACFNGITLIILGWIALFTLPKAYEMNKAQVDANLELARAKINEISTKLKAAIPMGRKAESEKDK